MNEKKESVLVRNEILSYLFLVIAYILVKLIVEYALTKTGLEKIDLYMDGAIAGVFAVSAVAISRKYRDKE